MKTKPKARVSRTQTLRDPAPRSVEPKRTTQTSPGAIQNNEAGASGWSWEIFLIAAFLLIGFAAVVVLFLVSLRP